MRKIDNEPSIQYCITFIRICMEKSIAGGILESLMGDVPSILVLGIMKQEDDCNEETN